ncbi:MAG: hypothetical protein EHM81_07770, partial [Chloroflexi bacterium]
GGLIRREPGKYHVYYVDRRERIRSSSVEANTSDGFKVSIAANITYQVNDPIKAQNVQKPLDALFAGIEAAIKSTIQTHKHDELIGERESGRRLGDNEIANRIIEQVSINHACRAFSLLNVSILSREGDSREIGLRERRGVQERESTVEREGIIQKHGIAGEANILDMIKAEGSGAVVLIAAKYDREKTLSTKDAEVLKIELQKMRNDPKYQQERYIKEIEKHTKALEALVNAQTRAGAQYSAIDMKMVEAGMSHISINESSNDRYEHQAEPPVPKEPKKVENHEDDDYIQLLIPKKKKK